MRLDVEIFSRKLVDSRSQAESYIKLGLVTVNGEVAKKSSQHVEDTDMLKVIGDQYVSRAALKLASVAEQFKLDFRDKIVLDVGSSTGGFTDFALQHGARRVIAIEVGTNQLHPRLRSNPKIELHEKTDIRNVYLVGNKSRDKQKGEVTLSKSPDIVVADVSFISLTQILAHVSSLMTPHSILVAMCKPQFEAGKSQINKGVVKNSAMRRQILRDFEYWLNSNKFIILNKADSQVAGAKGNVERFYLLKSR